MKVLVLGSFPPFKDRWSYPFFYPNKRNRLWPVLSQIVKRPLLHFEGKAAVEERKKILKDFKIGMHNMGKVIQRKGQSSLDNDIQILEFHDIVGFLKKNKKLKNIIISGYSGKTNAYQAFITHLKEKNIPFTKPKKVFASEEFFVNLENRKIRCVLANSTSPRAIQISFEMLIEQFQKGFIPLE